MYKLIFKCNGLTPHIFKNHITYLTHIEKFKHLNLHYELENDFWVAVRPSGTEPKIKFYSGVKGESLEDAEKKLKELSNAIKEIGNI